MLVNWCIRGELPGHSCKGQPQFTSTLHRLLPITVSVTMVILQNRARGKEMLAWLWIFLNTLPILPPPLPPSARPP